MVFLPAIPILLVVLLYATMLPAVGPRPPEPPPADETRLAWSERDVAGSVPGAGEPGPAATDPVPAAPDSPRLLREAVVVTAEDLLGTPYLYGGESPVLGFDCSGFVGHVYRQHGVRLPRTSRAQARVGREVAADLDRLRPGDLLFFATGGPAVDHVGLYAGDGRLLHASETGGDVRASQLGERGGDWLLDRLVTVRRIVE